MEEIKESITINVIFPLDFPFQFKTFEIQTKLTFKEACEEICRKIEYEYNDNEMALRVPQSLLKENHQEFEFLVMLPYFPSLETIEEHKSLIMKLVKLEIKIK